MCVSIKNISVSQKHPIMQKVDVMAVCLFSQWIYKWRAATLFKLKRLNSEVKLLKVIERVI